MLLVTRSGGDVLRRRALLERLDPPNSVVGLPQEAPVGGKIQASRLQGRRAEAQPTLSQPRGLEAAEGDGRNGGGIAVVVASMVGELGEDGILICAYLRWFLITPE